MSSSATTKQPHLVPNKDGRWGTGNKKQMCDHTLISCNHQGDIIILILIIKIMKIGRFVILKGISITREFGLIHLISFELVFFITVELSLQNICLLILLWTLCKCLLLSYHESILPFVSGNQPSPDGAESPILQSQGTTVLL